jgi:hypothetical protein
MPVDDNHDLVVALVRRYTVATQHYAWTVAELDRQRPTLPEDEYNRFYQLVEDAHSECEDLRTQIATLRYGPQ